MDTNQALTKLLANLRQKYNHLNGILDATRRLGKLAEQGEMESFGTVLNERGRSMQQIDRLSAENEEIVARLPGALRERIYACIRPQGGAAVTLENPMQTNLYDTSKRNGELLKRAADADAELTAKVNRLRARR